MIFITALTITKYNIMRKHVMLQVNTFYEVKISNNVNNSHRNTNILNMSDMPMWKIDLYG